MFGILRRKRGRLAPNNPKLKLTYRRAGGRKWLDTVSNPAGKLEPVIICQTGHPGFTVQQAKSPYRTISYGHRNAEKLAVNLAKKGRKKVSILD